MRWLAAAMLLCTVAVPAPRPQDKASGCVIARTYLAAAEAERVDDMLALFADSPRYEDVTFGFVVRTREEIAAMLKMTFASIQPVTRKTLRLICDEGGAAIEWQATGTHAARMLGVDPTGRTITVRAVSLLRVAGGRVESVTDYTDRAGLEKALGIPR